MQRRRVYTLVAVGVGLGIALGCAAFQEQAPKVGGILQKVRLVCEMATSLFPDAAPIRDVCDGYTSVYNGLSPSEREQQGEKACTQLAEIVTEQKSADERTAKKMLECAERGENCTDELAP